MPAVPDQYQSSTLPGLARAFRHWTATLATQSVVVPGATDHERHRLAALGGISSAVTDGCIPQAWPEDVRSWAKLGPQPPRAITDRMLSALESEEDPLGTLYNASISAPDRRRLGTVFTPAALVEHMFELVEGDLDGEAPAVVVDPGAGVGAGAPKPSPAGGRRSDRLPTVQPVEDGNSPTANGPAPGLEVILGES